jgi:hypothetical protein
MPESQLLIIHNETIQSKVNAALIAFIHGAEKNIIFIDESLCIIKEKISSYLIGRKSTNTNMYFVCDTKYIDEFIKNLPKIHEGVHEITIFTFDGIKDIKLTFETEFDIYDKMLVFVDTLIKNQTLYDYFIDMCPESINESLKKLYKSGSSLLDYKNMMNVGASIVNHQKRIAEGIIKRSYIRYITNEKCIYITTESNYIDVLHHIFRVFSVKRYQENVLFFIGLSCSVSPPDALKNFAYSSNYIIRIYWLQSDMVKYTKAMSIIYGAREIEGGCEFKIHSSDNPDDTINNFIKYVESTINVIINE